MSVKIRKFDIILCILVHTYKRFAKFSLFAKIYDRPDALKNFPGVKQIIFLTLEVASEIRAQFVTACNFRKLDHLCLPLSK
jgi:hypothetical protein